MSSNPSFIAAVTIQKEPVISEIPKVFILFFYNYYVSNSVLNETFFQNKTNSFFSKQVTVLRKTVQNILSRTKFGELHSDEARGPLTRVLAN